MEGITIDVERLRNDLRDDCLAAFFGGGYDGYGGALIESFDVDGAEPEELIKMAIRNGIDVTEYTIKEISVEGFVHGNER